MRKMIKIVAMTMILSTIVVSSFGQKIGVALAPQKLGYGIEYIHDFSKSVSLVAFFTKGEYVVGKTIKGRYVSSSIDADKYSIGVKYNKWVLAYNYSVLSNNNDKNNLFRIENTFTHSFDVGAIMDLNDRISSGITYDPLNYEGTIHFTYNLTK